MRSRGPMTRTALLLSCLFAAACSVGEVGTSNNGGTDGGTKTDGGATGNGCVTRLTPAGAEHPHTAPVNANNPTNAGENCVSAGCHLKASLGAVLLRTSTAARSTRPEGRCRASARRSCSRAASR